VADRLPARYTFEIPRTIQRIRKLSAKHVGLQFPDGLTLYATAIASILSEFTGVEVTILGDVVYGACCIDDLTSKQIGLDLSVHYGHSCLIPTDQTVVTTMYVFVDVAFSVDHFVETVELNVAPGSRVAILGTIQFAKAFPAAKALLEARKYVVDIPRCKPLSPGEVLGCTSPTLDLATDFVLFVADGRFHLESVMMQNIALSEAGKFLRYDPYTGRMTKEAFRHDWLRDARREQLKLAKAAKTIGLVLGTLGRQGSVGVLEAIADLLDARGIAHVTLLVSEISPQKLGRFGDSIDAFVQIACPRLSTDWGGAYPKPVLSSFEAFNLWSTEGQTEDHPMDYYDNRGGPWSNYGTRKGYGGSVKKKFWHLAQGGKDLSYEEVS